MDELFGGEFRPPDDSMIDFMLNLSASLTLVANRTTTSDQDALVLKQTAHSMRVLLAMAVGGHFLFSSEAKHADNLADLCSSLYDTLLMSGYADIESIDISSLTNFRSYREEGPDISEIPFFSQDDEL